VIVVLGIREDDLQAREVPPAHLGESVVALRYGLLPGEDQDQGCGEWEGKQSVTFSDAITAVRRWLWVEWVFAIPGYKPAFQKLSRPFRYLLLHALAPAA
jgi:hypothetical protein